MFNPLVVSESIKEKEDPMVRLRLLKLDWWSKDYSEKKRIDYEETFSLVVMLKSIRVLLSIAAHFNYEN